MTTLTVSYLEAQLLELQTQVEKVGEIADTGFAVDFDSPLLGSPYLYGTGFLPTLELAQDVASVVIERLTLLAAIAVKLQPDEYDGWADPEHEIRAYCRIVSAERDEIDEPTYEETFHGDVWFVAGTTLPFTQNPDEQRRWAAVKELLGG